MIASQDLEFFAVVAAAPSLAAAARSLGVTPSAVTQRLGQLERRLQVRLVDRSSRRLHLTAEGELLARQGREVLADLELLADELSRRSEHVTGRLRVAAPFGFGRKHVAPAMAAAQARHPELDIDLRLFEDPAGSLSVENWDVLIHIGALWDSSLTMRKLAPNRRILCAAPDYADRAPALRTPDDLADHACGVIRENQDDVSLWTFRRGDDAAVRTIRIAPRFVSNDGQVVTDWAKAGLGVIARSEWDVAADLRNGELVELLPQWRLPDADVVALLGSRSGRLARTALFLDLLGERLRDPPWRMDQAAL